MTDGPGPCPSHNLWPLQAPGTAPLKETRGKGKGLVHFVVDAGTNLEGLASKGFASPAWQRTEAGAGQTQEIINPNQALPSQEAPAGSCHKKILSPRAPRAAGGGLRPPPLSPQPSASTSISCDNLQTEDQLASPPRPGSGSTPAPPRPRPRAPAAGGPGTEQFPSPSSPPWARPDRLSLCHTHPEKLRARWDRTSGVRSSTRGRPAGTREGPRP